MAIKTFTAGSVLTASDTNTYLANSGLVYIKSGTATSGISFDLTECFSSTYDSYRVVINNVRINNGDTLAMQLLSNTTPANTNYYVSVIRFDIGANAVSTVRSNGDSYAAIGYATNSAGASCSASFDVSNPFSAVTTSIMGQGTDSRGASGYAAWQFAGIHNVASSYNGIRIASVTGAPNTFSSGTITVYGYRKA